jgi:hypothetical protein
VLTATPAGRCVLSEAVAFNIDIAAERLGVKRRWLQDWLRGHPHDKYGKAFYRLAGKTKLFTAGDLDRILESLPQPDPICLGLEPPEVLKERERELREMTERLSHWDEELGASEHYQPGLQEELIDYHHEYSPVLKADIVFRCG